MGYFMKEENPQQGTRGNAGSAWNAPSIRGIRKPAKTERRSPWRE